jgi:RimJ/RimL family protein N-acetyltransferase
VLDDPAVLRYTGVPDPPRAGFAREWIERYAKGRREGTKEGFAAIDGDGAFAGLALAPRINREGRELELGYLTAPAARGRGLATEMLQLLTRWAFEQGALRIELLIDTSNAASQRVAERCGYRREGVLRSKHFKDDLRIDTEVWSRLPTDPSP